MLRSKTGLTFCAITLGSWSLAAGAIATRYDNPTVPDVRAAFDHIDSTGTRLGARAEGTVPYPYYSFNADHIYTDNHFQGTQRLRTPGWIVVSGSNINPRGAQTGPHGDLFFVRLGGNHSGNSALGPGIDPITGLPRAGDRLFADLTVALPLPNGTPLWHPGGISVLGDILVVPVENYTDRLGVVCSQVWFYDVTNPEKPVRLAPVIDRTTPPVRDKAGAASMVRLDDGRFLLALRTTTQLSFYLSKTTVLAEGFEDRPVVLDEREALAAPGVKQAKFNGPSFQLVKQSDGRLFIVGFRRQRDGAATAGALDPEAQHIASLFSLEFPKGDFRATPVLTRLGERAFGADLLGPDGWGDFSAAPGLFITDSGGLAIYSAPRWLVAHIGAVRPTVPPAAHDPAAREALFMPLAEFWPVTAAVSPPHG